MASRLPLTPWFLQPTILFRQTSDFLRALGDIAFVLFFDLTCCVQDVLSVRLRQLRHSRLSEPPLAMRLPPEILATIFEILRLRARYGQPFQYPAVGWDSGHLHRTAYRDLLSAQQVCTAWRGPATEVLCRHVAVRTTEDLWMFVETNLLREVGREHSGSTIRVQSLHIPRGEDFNPERIRGRKQLTLRQTELLERVNELIFDADGPRELTLSVDMRVLNPPPAASETKTLERDSSLASRETTGSPYISRLRSLRLTGTYVGGRAGGYSVLAATSPLFTSSTFHNLHILWLSNVGLNQSCLPTAALALFPHLRTLRVSNSSMSGFWLRDLTRACPDLRSVELLYLQILAPDGVTLPDLVQLLEACSERLTALTARHIDHPLGDLSQLTTLRSLIITDEYLRDSHVVTNMCPPPVLEELVVLGCHPPTETAFCSTKADEAFPRHQLWAFIRSLWGLAQRWKEQCPEFCGVELWDQVGTQSWASWQAVGLLLGGALESRGVKLDIHLSCVNCLSSWPVANRHYSLHWVTQRHYKEKLTLQRQWQRLLWQDGL